MRRYGTLFSAAGEEEIRVPAECLAALGLAEGARVVVEAVPGRLLVTPDWDAAAVRADLDAIARDLAGVRERLRRVAGLLPAPDEADSAAADPGADLLGTLECILADDLEPALAKLRQAVGMMGP